MDTFKNYFKKKNLDRKFRKAGEGHVLSEESQPKASHSLPVESRMPPSSEATRAGEAAIARLDNQNKKSEGKHRHHYLTTDSPTVNSDSNNDSLKSVSHQMEANQAATAGKPYFFKFIE